MERIEEHRKEGLTELQIKAEKKEEKENVLEQGGEQKHSGSKQLYDFII